MDPVQETMTASLQKTDGESIYEILCSDGVRRLMIRANETAAEMTLAQFRVRCPSRDVGHPFDGSRCPGGPHIYQRVSKEDPRYAKLLEEDDWDNPVVRYRGAIEQYIGGLFSLPGMPIKLEDK